MTAPLFESGLFGHGAGLLYAFLIGVSFGFLLERGGLGNAGKLAGQFYLTDFTMFRVMFTAIVTAMLGLFWLSWFGLVDLPRIYLNPTYLLPQLIAGLLFGAGFITGGLCPGTSLVAVATGRIDGLVLLGGFLCGIFLFGETFDRFYRFAYSTPLGKVGIMDLLRVPHGIVVLLVVLMALGGFALAGKLDRTRGLSGADRP